MGCKRGRVVSKAAFQFDRSSASSREPEELSKLIMPLRMRIETSGKRSLRWRGLIMCTAKIQEGG